MFTEGCYLKPLILHVHVHVCFNPVMLMLCIIILLCTEFPLLLNKANLNLQKRMLIAIPILSLLVKAVMAHPEEWGEALDKEATGNFHQYPLYYGPPGSTSSPAMKIIVREKTSDIYIQVPIACEVCMYQVVSCSPKMLTTPQTSTILKVSGWQKKAVSGQGSKCQRPVS